MATVSPNPATGEALYDGEQEFRAHDDRLDNKSAGTYVHEPTEFSATELEEMLDVIRYIISVQKARFALSELTDVNLTGLTDGDMLIWNASTSHWIRTPPTDTDEKVKADSGDTTAGYLSDKVDGSTIEVTAGNKLAVKEITNTQVASAAAIAWSKINKTGAVPGDVGAAATSHNHAASEITSGNLDIARIHLESLVELTGNPALAAAAHGKTYVNLTSTRKDPTLPAASAGLRVRFMCLHSDGIRLTAAADDRIRYAADVTTADTGYVQGTATGNVIELEAVDAVTWVVISAVGAWTLTAS